jgi:hypothetical protein
MTVAAKDLTPEEWALHVCCRWVWPKYALCCGYCGKKLHDLAASRAYGIKHVSRKNEVGYESGPYIKLEEALDEIGMDGEIIYILPFDVPFYRWRKNHWHLLNVDADNLNPFKNGYKSLIKKNVSD